MSKFTYKNISDRDIMIPGHGLLKKGSQFSTDTKIETPALREVKATEDKTVSKEKDNGTAGN